MANPGRSAATVAFRRIKTDGSGMRITVIIDDDVCVRVTQIAETSGRTFGQVISQLAREGLVSDLSRHVEANHVAPESAKAEVPVFRVLIGAAMIPGNRAGAA